MLREHLDQSDRHGQSAPPRRRLRLTEPDQTSTPAHDRLRYRERPGREVQMTYP
jgi:hypothetical protein